MICIFRFYCPLHWYLNNNHTNRWCKIEYRGCWQMMGECFELSDGPIQSIFKYSSPPQFDQFFTTPTVTSFYLQWQEEYFGRISIDWILILGLSTPWEDQQALCWWYHVFFPMWEYGTILSCIVFPPVVHHILMIEQKMALHMDGINEVWWCGSSEQLKMIQSLGVNFWHNKIIIIIYIVCHMDVSTYVRLVL